MKILLVGSKLQEYSFEEVIEQFKGTIKGESYRFVDYNPNIGYDEDDIEQELLMVLYDCYINYSDLNIHFSTYLYTSINNHFANLIRKYQSMKREGISSEDSLDRVVYGESTQTLLEFQESSINTEDMYMTRHIINTINSVTHSKLEKDIVDYFLEVITVSEIAAKHSVSRRTVYNHIDKLREKLRVLLI